ncbi:GtrA family protein [Candidatus Woesearchaeota archaeon]|nr:GtrA family protein [Candidatus Woesearchaeota archaeon]
MRKYLTFVIGGGIGVLLAAAITTTLTEILQLWYALSYALGLTAGTTFKFLYHRSITFNRLSRAGGRFAKYVFATIVMAMANWSLVYLITETAAEILQQDASAAYYLPAMLGVTIFMSAANYLVSKHWIFREY